MSSGAGASSAQLPLLRNRTFDEISVGDSESIERTLTSKDLQLYAVISGDHSPQQPAGEGRAAKEAGGDFQGVIAHGMWAGALISAVIGTRLPGPGTTYLGQSLRFRATVRVGDTLTIRVTVTDRDAASRQLRLACSGVKQDGTAVIDGEAEVVAPHEHLEFHRVALPEVRLSAGIGGLQRLLEHVRPLGSIRVEVVHPCDAWSGHRAQRHRPRPGDRRRGAAGGYSRRRGDCQLFHAGDARRGGALQDGRPRPDQRRHPRRPARLRQRGLDGCRAASAGIVLGAKVPVILTSRADSRESRIASCAIALMLARHYQVSPP